MGEVVGGIFGMMGANKQAKAAEKAAEGQVEAARIGAETQREALDTSVQLGNPWRHAGQNALGALAFELGLGPKPTFGEAPSFIGANDPKPLSELYGRQDATPQAGVPQNALAAVKGPDGTWSVPEWATDPGYFEGVGLPARRATMGRSMVAPQQQVAAPTPVAAPPAKRTGFAYKGFQATPGYQFNLDEGQKAIDRSLAARGGLLSGSAVKAGMRFGQGLANQEYTNHLARLASMSGLGGGFASQAGQNAIATGGNIANTLTTGAARAGAFQTEAGASRASGYNALGNGIGTGINSLARVIAGGL